MSESGSELRIASLHAGIDGQEILRGIDLVVKSGEVHAIMGPNGAGKSTLGNVLMGHVGFEVSSGSVTLDGIDLLSLPTHARAHAGLHLAPQNPVEIPGVGLIDVIAAALSYRGFEVDIAQLGKTAIEEGTAIGLSSALVSRPLNVDSSGGEKKRVETLQLALLHPRIAVLDELDSGLDVDALRHVARRIARLARPEDSTDTSSALGVLAITHYRRLLEELEPDFVHVLVAGQVVASGGPELAVELERDGYGAFVGAGSDLGNM